MTVSPWLAFARHFVYTVLSDFKRSQALLLSGAVAYNTLLSIVPLFAVLLVALSHLVDEQRLLETVASNLELLIPGQADAITDQVRGFLAQRQVVGVVGIVGLLFFSSMAFTVLENAIAAIFYHRAAIRPRHLLVSALLPYMFIMLLGIGLLLVTIISGALEAVGRDSIAVFGHRWSLAGVPGAVLYVLGIVGLMLMLTALYMALPVGQVAFRHALIGGVAATLSWEVVRHALVWYFARLSMVNLVYGSLATAVIVLLTLEAAALILLFGAEVIAEVERVRSPRSG
jgi:membrane protein